MWYIICSLKVIHDPQTRTNTRKEFENYHNKNRTNLLVDYCYNHLNVNVVKCCYVSYSIKEYKELIDYCISQNINIIILHRNKVNNRALSKCCAQKLGNYGPYKNEKNKFKIDIKYYEKCIINYYNKSKSIIKYIESKKRKYYYIIFEEFYSNIDNIYKFFNYIKVKITDNTGFLKTATKDYNTSAKNNLIINIDKIKYFDRSFKLIPNMMLKYENLLYRIIIK